MQENSALWRKTSLRLFRVLYEPRHCTSEITGRWSYIELLEIGKYYHSLDGCKGVMIDRELEDFLKSNYNLMELVTLTESRRFGYKI